MRQDQFIPHLIVSDGLAAIKFYKEVFDINEVQKYLGDLRMDIQREGHGDWEE
jgi:hypothetical protein